MDTTNLLNRRTALKGLAASAAVVATVAPAVANGPTMADLIDRYAAAWAALEAASDKAELAGDEFAKRFPSHVIIPTLTAKDGTPNSAIQVGRYHLDREELVARIAANHAKRLARMVEDFVLSDNKSATNAVKKALDASQARCIAALDEAIARSGAIRAEVGLDRLEAAYDATCEAADQAAFAVLRYEPTSLEEAQMKGRWLLYFYKQQGDCLATSHIEALATSYGAEVA